MTSPIIAARRALLVTPLLVAACVHSPPSIGGAPGAPAQPDAYWTPPPRIAAQVQRDEPSQAPTALTSAVGRLTLPDIVDLALRNNPATRLSWAQARAAADTYGASRGSLFPTLTADVVGTRTRALAAPGRPAGERTQYGPSFGLSWLVLDFGGRSGSIDAARQTAIAADLSHNVAVQNTILQVELALFDYLATRALRDAARVSVDEARASLNAAEERRRVGLATIADVLKARTALSQTQLTLESFEGGMLVAQGGLAVAMGLQANASYEVPNLPDAPPPDSLHGVTQSVDTLIAVAARMRPDLAAVRAEAAAAAADVRIARSALMPSISFNAVGGYTGSDVPTFRGRTYTIGLGFDLPVFSGFSREYSVRAATAELEAARARTDLTRQQVALQVFTAYYTLQTATERVRTAADLLASATESESVARGQYREGVGSIVDLLIAQSALAEARAQNVQARWQWRGSLAQLAHDVGVLGLRGEVLSPVGTENR